jgi:hypothetical protein
MGLKADFQEVATVWNQSSWRVRIYLALSAFLASGSIASLSETVFRWKGFMADAVLFYQTYISGPLHRVLVLFFAHVPEGVSHLLILSALYLGASLRVAYFALPSTKTRLVARRSVTGYVGAAIAVFIVGHYTGRELDGMSALGFFLGSALAASFSYWRAGGAARILWFVHLLGPFVIIGLAAAFASGLARPA